MSKEELRSLMVTGRIASILTAVLYIAVCGFLGLHLSGLIPSYSYQICFGIVGIVSIISMFCIYRYVLEFCRESIRFYIKLLFLFTILGAFASSLYWFQSLSAVLSVDRLIERGVEIQLLSDTYIDYSVDLDYLWSSLIFGLAISLMFKLIYKEDIFTKKIKIMGFTAYFLCMFISIFHMTGIELDIAGVFIKLGHFPSVIVCLFLSPVFNILLVKFFTKEITQLDKEEIR